MLAVSSAVGVAPEVLLSAGAIPPHLAGRFRDVRAFQQTVAGHYLVFDQRAHTVFVLDESLTGVWPLVQVGTEPGRLIGPTAFSLAPDGTFVVADAPQGLARIQAFAPAGTRTAGFTLPGRARPRVRFEEAILNGVGSLHYTGTSVLVSQPENGALVTEYSISGVRSRSFGRLRATGHEDDPDVHLALNTGIPLVDPRGGFFFVFLTGEPLFRKYDVEGRLIFERRMQGREIDDLVAALPTSWPRRDEGDLPLVTPTVRTAAVDREGRLWVSFVAPYTYVFDRDGDKIRAVQFRGAGILSPAGLAFAPNGRLLVTPGLYEFVPE